MKNAYSYKSGIIGLVLSIIALATGALAIIGITGIVISMVGLAYTTKKNKIARWARAQEVKAWANDKEIKEAYKHRDDLHRSTP
ncbi:MAG TPA: hypothetical protein VFI70_01540 [Nitrososphaeraceae archaeon]|nr:hypothetical protein [Nitrososphaeraceae archaeon]